MDDYLMEILLEQNGETRPLETERLLRSLGESLEQNGSVGAGEASRGRKQNPIPGDREQEENRRLYLARLSGQLDTWTPAMAAFSEDRRRTDGSAQAGKSWELEGAWQTETERALSPEELSLFFQRDARRYS